MKIGILTAGDVQTALPMDKAIDVMQRAFSQVSVGMYLPHPPSFLLANLS